MRAPFVLVASAALGLPGCTGSGDKTDPPAASTAKNPDIGGAPDPPSDSAEHDEGEDDGPMPKSTDDEDDSGADATTGDETPPEAVATLKQASGALNFVDTLGRVIYRGNGPECFVHLPFPEGSMPPPGSMPPTQTLDCPEPMKDESWKACVGDRVVHAKPDATPEGKDCICMITGNPPPPPKPIACPKTK